MLRRPLGVGTVLVWMGLLIVGGSPIAVQGQSIPRISDLEYLPPAILQAEAGPAPLRDPDETTRPPRPRRLPAVEPRGARLPVTITAQPVEPPATPVSTASNLAVGTTAVAALPGGTAVEAAGLEMPPDAELLPPPPPDSPPPRPHRLPAVAAPDAAVAAPDASLAAPDASLAAPDASLAAPDAAVVAPDAAVVAPDAAVVTPHASAAGALLSCPRLPAEWLSAGDLPENAAFSPSDFSPTPLPTGSDLFDPIAEQSVYDLKSEVPTQRPWIEWGRPFYGSGIAAPGGLLFGKTNLTQPEFYVYGDHRTGISSGRNAIGRIDNLATRLNLDLDWRWTATERLHAFVGPLNRAANFTQVRYADGSFELDRFVNLNPVTAFFEGDAGALLGGIHGTPSPFEFPFTVGLVPLLYQNGIWMEDAVTGAAVALPARHSTLLDWANFDATAFAIVDQLNSPAFGADPHAAQAVGTAWFIEAYGGYIESGWAYLHDRAGQGRSYHNVTASFTRRYWDRISNSLRVIVNAGQDLPERDRTADGGLLLIETSLVTANPLTLVPYLNLFAGWDRPQSIARAGVSGGILRNVGINFDTDGLNGYPTLDASGNDTYGGAIGVDVLGKDLDRQLVVELAYLRPHGGQVNRISPADQAAAGVRYQFPLSHRTLLRMDAMYGWRDRLPDVYGTRMEYRWKF